MRRAGGDGLIGGSGGFGRDGELDQRSGLSSQIEGNDLGVKSTPPARQAQHSEPIWRERSNFIIAAAVDSAGTAVTSEQLWARQLSDHVFEICCIPFFAYNLALGDEVETDHGYVITRVVRASGRYVFRVILNAGTESARRQLVVRLSDIDARLEWYSMTMAAIDVRTEIEGQRAADVLWAGELAGDWAYESGKI